MLLATAGLGVPGSFAQGTNGKASSKKRTPVSSSKSSSSKAAPAKSPAAHPSSKRPASHSSVKKATSSSRSRRQPGQKAPTNDRITEIQSALAKDGSFAGIPNGKWGDDTTAAMRKFQSAHGLNPTGKLDAPTLQRLGLGSQTAGVAAPTPPPGAVSRLTSSNSFP
jgi:peptidoglycan hydrolase-like protein with peptidoglycan-binding domain